MATMITAEIRLRERSSWRLMHDDGQVETAVGLYSLITFTMTAWPSAVRGQYCALVMLAGALCAIWLQRTLVIPRRGFVSFRAARMIRYALLAAGLTGYCLLIGLYASFPTGMLHNVDRRILYEILRTPIVTSLLIDFLPFALVAWSLGQRRLYWFGAIMALSWFLPASVIWLQPAGRMTADLLFVALSFFRIGLILFITGFGIHRMTRLVNTLPAQDSTLEVNDVTS